MLPLLRRVYRARRRGGCAEFAGGENRSGTESAGVGGVVFGLVGVFTKRLHTRLLGEKAGRGKKRELEIVYYQSL